MRLLIETKNECMLLDAVNIVVIKNPRRDVKNPCIEISCTNHEVYRISCFQNGEKSVEKFISYCTNAINTIYDARRQGQHSFTLTFDNYNTVFEKNSFNSCIE